jgi:hypothetical protein
MNYEMIILRLLHIVFGVFWAGSAIFFALILQPRLARLGPAIAGPVMAALVPVMSRALIGSAVITIVAGITLALRLRWGHLDAFYNTGWGIAIMIGFVAAMGAISSGITLTVKAHRMIALGASIRDRPPTPEEAAQLQRLSVVLPRLGRSTAVMVIFAIGAMASARFV